MMPAPHGSPVHRCTARPRRRPPGTHRPVRSGSGPGGRLGGLLEVAHLLQAGAVHHVGHRPVAARLGRSPPRLPPAARPTPTLLAEQRDEDPGLLLAEPGQREQPGQSSLRPAAARRARSPRRRRRSGRRRAAASACTRPAIARGSGAPRADRPSAPRTPLHRVPATAAGSACRPPSARRSAPGR